MTGPTEDQAWLDALEGELGDVVAETDAAVEEWVEVNVTGRPHGDYPPYDFTFRSDRDAWQHLAGILRRAAESHWTEVKLRYRRVRRETWSTDWRGGDSTT